MDAEHLGSGASRTCSANWRNELLYCVAADRTYCFRTGCVNSCIPLRELGDLFLGTFQPTAGALGTAPGFEWRESVWADMDGSSADSRLVVVAPRSIGSRQGVLGSADVDRTGSALDNDLVLPVSGRGRYVACAYGADVQVAPA